MREHFGTNQPAHSVLRVGERISAIGWHEFIRESPPTDRNVGSHPERWSEVHLTEVHDALGGRGRFEKHARFVARREARREEADRERTRFATRLREVVLEVDDSPEWQWPEGAVDLTRSDLWPLVLDEIKAKV